MIKIYVDKNKVPSPISITLKEALLKCNKNIFLKNSSLTQKRSIYVIILYTLL